MSIEIFICRGQQAAVQSVDNVCGFLSKRLGVRCIVEQLADGQWIVLDGTEIDMSVTEDDTGKATSAMIQVGLNSDPVVVNRVCRIFEEQGWDVYGPGEN